MWPVLDFYLERAAPPLLLFILCIAGLVVGLRYRFRRGARWFAIGCGLMAAEHVIRVASATLLVLLSTDVTNRFRTLFVSGSLAETLVSALATIAWVAGLACVIAGFAKATRQPTSPIP